MYNINNNNNNSLDNSLFFMFYSYRGNSLLKKLCPEIIDSLDLNVKSDKVRSTYIDYLKQIVCNLIWGYKYDKSVVIPRDKNTYSTAKYKYIKFNKFIKLLDVLYNAGYIDYKKGFYSHQNKKECYVSRYWATEKLSKYFTPDNTDNISLKYSYIPPIILRDEAKNEVDLTGKRTPPLLREKINKINKVFKQNQIFITLEDKQTVQLKPNLSAIFCNNSWKQGGRLYDKTPLPYSYQRVKNKTGYEKRKTIKINNNETVELDYTGLHVNMLYAQEGIQYSSNDDPYSFLGSTKSKRKYAKKFILIIINSNERHIKKVYKSKKRTQAYITAKETHREIEKYFFSGEGIFLQNKDGKMSLKIVSHFARKGIACLPVHDSYIVEKQYKDELRQVMHDVYKKYNNGFTCGIKEKL
ncbi:MAG: hypothetical protein PHX78_12275 [bacterium]|nr:hypothetical protein [bacterium]